MYIPILSREGENARFMRDEIRAAKVAYAVRWIDPDVTQYIFKIVRKYNGPAFTLFGFVFFKAAIDNVPRKTLEIPYDIL